jgi:hypothetical protein
MFKPMRPQCVRMFKPMRPHAPGNACLHAQA